MTHLARLRAQEVMQAEYEVLGGVESSPYFQILCECLSPSPPMEEAFGSEWKHL